MLTALALLAIPTFVLILATLVSRQRITLKEWGVMQAVVTVLVLGSYGIALHSRTQDTELWNGVITAKNAGRQHCCHSYSCNCRETCSGSGKNRSCSTTCDTCYLHSYDEFYNASMSTGDEVYSNVCNSPGTPVPARWTAIVPGEPASVTKSYTNYILGNPDTILRRRGLANKYKLPPYPFVYDLYRVARLIPDGVQIPDAFQLNQKLGALAGQLGATRQVNPIVIVTNSPDREYAEGLREAWLGGKKNDAILVVGAPNFPEIAWADVVSWTKNEDFKVNLKDDVEALKTWNSDKIVEAFGANINLRYKRRHMKDFEYLWASIEPSSTAQWTIAILSLLVSLGLCWFFWVNDPFGYGSIRGRYPRNNLGLGFGAYPRNRVPNLRRWY